MSDKRLKEATAVIRSGDKEAGKELLLDILQDNPENDIAWVWMSAVVDTDDLRLECLEEALKYNPDNRMAQKGVAKLKKKVQETAVSSQFASSAPKLSSSIVATLDYLCRRLIIEKQYQFVKNPTTNHATLDTIEFDAPHKLRVDPIVEYPELNPLAPFFDAVLLRKGGGTFTVICMKIRDAQKLDNTFVSQDTLIKVGQACIQHAPRLMYGQKAPVNFEIWEFFEREFTPDDKKRLQALKRVPGLKQVMVTGLAIDVFSRKVKSFNPGAAALFNAYYPQKINRWLEEENSFSEAEAQRIVADGGLKFGPIVLGIGIGVTLAIMIDFLLYYLQWPSGWVVDMIGAITAVMIAIFARKVRVDNRRQSVIAAGLYGVVYYSVMLFFFGYWLGFWWLWNIGWMIAWGAFLGRVTDP